MAKKEAMVCPPNGCQKCKWVGVVVTVVGAWFTLADLGVLGTWGLSLFSVLTLVAGLSLWCKSKFCK